MLPGIKLFELTDRVAIITGGSKGLGEAMGAGLASAGQTRRLAVSLLKMAGLSGAGAQRPAARHMPRPKLFSWLVMPRAGQRLMFLWNLAPISDAPLLVPMRWLMRVSPVW